MRNKISLCPACNNPVHCSARRCSNCGRSSAAEQISNVGRSLLAFGFVVIVFPILMIIFVAILGMVLNP